MIIEIEDGILHLWGALTAQAASALAVTTRQAAHHGVVLDMHGVTQATPDGAARVRDLAASIMGASSGARLVLAGASSGVARALSASGTTIASAPTVAAAQSLLSSGAENGMLRSVPVAPGSSRVPVHLAQMNPVILVGLFGVSTDEHAVAVGCRLAESIAPDTATGAAVAHLHLARLLMVARDKTLSADGDTDAEATGAKKALRQFAVAAQDDGSCVANVSVRVERTRDGGARLTELARDFGATFLVLAFGANASAEDVELARFVVERAPCEVIVNRVPVSELRPATVAP